MQKKKYVFAVLMMLILFSSCYNHKLITTSLPGTESKKAISNAYFWGLAVKPANITTPICDSIGSTGVTEVTVEKNFGNGLVSFLTLGFYSRVWIIYKCNKPCPKPTQTL
jgi:hypothetical protein